MDVIFRVGETVAEIVRISEPIKKHWAKKMEISVEELLGTTTLWFYNSNVDGF